jgi:hypothetical protein
MFYDSYIASRSKNIILHYKQISSALSSRFVNEICANALTKLQPTHHKAALTRHSSQDNTQYSMNYMEVRLKSYAPITVCGLASRL